MNDRLALGIGIVLLVFPLLGIYATWKTWLAFALGLVLVIASIMAMVRSDIQEEDEVQS